MPKEEAIQREDLLLKLMPVNLEAETEKQSKARLMDTAMDEGSIPHLCSVEIKILSSLWVAAYGSRGSDILCS
jgi:hypothetical protein